MRLFYRNKGLRYYDVVKSDATHVWVFPCHDKLLWSHSTRKSTSDMQSVMTRPFDHSETHRVEMILLRIKGADEMHDDRGDSRLLMGNVSCYTWRISTQLLNLINSSVSGFHRWNQNIKKPPHPQVSCWICHSQCAICVIVIVVDKYQLAIPCESAICCCLK